MLDGQLPDGATVQELEVRVAPVTGYMNQREAKRDISYYLMDYYNWQRPHQHWI